MRFTMDQYDKKSTFWGKHISHVLKAITLIAITSLSGNCYSQAPFITKWNTSNPGNSDDASITIPVHPDASLVYNYDIDWDNDGRYDTLGVTGSIRHNYGQPGIYEVAIRGNFPRIFFFNADDPEKIIEIKQWGDIAWESFKGAFEDCSNLQVKAKDAPDLSQASNMSFSQMFKNASNFTGNLSGWDVSNVRFMIGTFQGTQKFNSDISGWDLSSCNSLVNIFLDATGFNQDISAWDVGDIGNFENAFSGSTSFNQDLGDWDMSSANNLSGIFDNSGMTSKNYDRTIRGWANQSGSLQSNVTVGAANVKYCNSISSRNTLGTTHSWAFNADISDCQNELFISKWDTQNNGSSNSNSIEIPISDLNSPYDIDWNNDGIFDAIGITGPQTHEYSNAGIHEVAIRADYLSVKFPLVFGDNDKLLEIVQWGGIEWTDMSEAYQECSNLTITANDAPDLSNCNSLYQTFRGATSFNQSINHWDVSTITNMVALFFNCTSFNQPLNDWDVSNASCLASMFRGATDFNQPLDKWDVSNVDNMYSMFRDASSFHQNIGGWKTLKLENAGNMFSGATSFSWQLRNWDVSKLTNASGMLDSCGLTTQLYGFTLLGWSSQDVQEDIQVGAAGLSYCEFESSRKKLIDDFNWSFIGDQLQGFECITNCGSIENELTQNADWYSSTSSWSYSETPNPCHNIMIPANLILNLITNTNDPAFNRGFGSTLEIENGATFVVQQGAELEIKQFTPVDPGQQ